MINYRRIVINPNKFSKMIKIDRKPETIEIFMRMYTSFRSDFINDRISLMIGGETSVSHDQDCVDRNIFIFLKIQ